MEKLRASQRSRAGLSTTSVKTVGYPNYFIQGQRVIFPSFLPKHLRAIYLARINAPRIFEDIDIQEVEVVYDAESAEEYVLEESEPESLVEEVIFETGHFVKKGESVAKPRRQKKVPKTALYSTDVTGNHDIGVYGHMGHLPPRNYRYRQLFGFSGSPGDEYRMLNDLRDQDNRKTEVLESGRYFELHKSIIEERLYEELALRFARPKIMKKIRPIENKDSGDVYSVETRSRDVRMLHGQVLDKIRKNPSEHRWVLIGAAQLKSMTEGNLTKDQYTFIENYKKLNQNSWSANGQALVDCVLFILDQNWGSWEDLYDRIQRMAQRYGAVPWLYHLLCTILESKTYSFQDLEMAECRLLEILALCRSKAPQSSVIDHANLDRACFILVSRIVVTLVRQGNAKSARTSLEAFTSLLISGLKASRSNDSVWDHAEIDLRLPETEPTQSSAWMDKEGRSFRKNLGEPNSTRCRPAEIIKTLRLSLPTFVNGQWIHWFSDMMTFLGAPLHCSMSSSDPICQIAFSHGLASDIAENTSLVCPWIIPWSILIRPRQTIRSVLLEGWIEVLGRMALSLALETVNIDIIAICFLCHEDKGKIAQEFLPRLEPHQQTKIWILLALYRFSESNFSQARFILHQVVKLSPDSDLLAQVIAIWVHAELLCQPPPNCLSTLKLLAAPLMTDFTELLADFDDKQMMSPQNWNDVRSWWSSKLRMSEKQDLTTVHVSEIYKFGPRNSNHWLIDTLQAMKYVNAVIALAAAQNDLVFDDSRLETPIFDLLEFTGDPGDETLACWIADALICYCYQPLDLAMAKIYEQFPNNPRITQLYLNSIRHRLPSFKLCILATKTMREHRIKEFHKLTTTNLAHPTFVLKQFLSYICHCEDRSEIWKPTLSRIYKVIHERNKSRAEWEVTLLSKFEDNAAMLYSRLGPDYHFDQLLAASDISKDHLTPDFPTLYKSFDYADRRLTATVLIEAIKWMDKTTAVEDSVAMEIIVDSATRREVFTNELVALVA